MPRWARFLSCSLTATALLAAGLPVAAWVRAGGAQYWRLLLEFLATPEFFSLLGLTAALSVLCVLLGRILTGLYGWHSAAGALGAGVLVASACTSFLVSTHAFAWGGWAAALVRTLPDLPYFWAPFLVASLAAAWLWDRLE